MNIRRAVGTLLLLAGLAGCTSLNPVFEARTGQVLDGETLQPIKGAQIEAQSWMVKRPTMRPTRVVRTFRTVTAEDGTWNVPEDTNTPNLREREQPIQQFVESYRFSAPGYRTEKYGPRQGSEVEWYSPRIPKTLMLLPMRR